MKIISSLFSVTILFAVSVGAVSANARVVVMDFQDQSASGEADLGRNVSNMLTTALVKHAKLSVVNRDKLVSLIKQQHPGDDRALFDASIVADVAKSEGVHYVVTGIISAYGKSSSKTSSRKEGSLFDIGKKSHHATVDMQIVDANTADIVYADTASNSESTLDLSSLALDVTGSGSGNQSALKAMRKTVNQLATTIAGIGLQPTQLAANTQSRSSGSAANAIVADVDGDILTLNKGTNAGFKVGQKVTIFSHKGKEIKDPATGEVIRVKYKKLGTIELTDVGDSYSEGTVVGEGNKGFEVQNIAK